MATRSLTIPARHLFTGFRPAKQTLSRCSARGVVTLAEDAQSSPSSILLDPQQSRSDSAFATNSSISSSSSTVQAILATIPKQHVPPRNPFITNVHCTTYSFPSMEPSAIIQYPSTHLALPLRKDILHRAVIYEADMTRAGTASTKWRNEIHGSGRKLRPQKGTGKARLGDRGSPMLRGGGVAFGPKPRDFSTELPRKIYDLAFRTALSHRYRSGELTILDGPAELDAGLSSPARYLRDILHHTGMGRAEGRAFFVTSEVREGLFAAFANESMGKEGRIRAVDDVDVKNLLEMGRIVIEREALEWLLLQHESDVTTQSRLLKWRRAEAAQQ